MGDSKRKWTTNEEASHKRRNLSNMSYGEDFEVQTKIDDLILEAIAKLNDPQGSSESMIFRHVLTHETTSSILELEWQLTPRLDVLVKKGKIMKAANGRYKTHSEEELEQMKKMSSIHEAEMVAAKAVIEAEAIIVATERALEEVREAEAVAEQLAGCSITSHQQWWENIYDD